VIDAAAGERLLAALPGELDDAEASRWIAGQPAFQNIAYPVALPPLVVDGRRLDEHRATVEAYVALLEKLIALYRGDREVRALFGLGPVADELIDAEGPPVREIRVCRLDGYVEQGTGRLQILENNADCPAGTLFTPRLNAIVRRLIGARAPRPRLPMDDGDPFTALLAGEATGRGLEIAVLQLRGRSNRESHEVAAVLNAAGHRTSVVDPRELELTADGLVAAGRRLDVVWNKINTAAFCELVTEAPELVGRLAAAARHPGAPRMINSHGARHVAEAKTSLAVLHSAELAGRVTDDERALIARVVPWTVRLDRDAEVEYDGSRWPLATLTVERRAELVLKQRYDIRGDGVTIGRATPPDAWDAAIAAAWGTGAVLQRYVAPTRYPVRLLGGGPPAELNTSLDSFVFDGRLVGLGAKASARDKVNLFQGGSKLAVVVGDLP
jgi:hypothetical protein